MIRKKAVTYDCGYTDGNVDELFREQILKFQRDNGLVETGVCNVSTRDCIEKNVNIPVLFPVLRENNDGALLYGLIDIDGNMVVPAEYERYEFQNGVYSLKKGSFETYRHDYFYNTGKKVELPYYDSNGNR